MVLIVICSSQPGLFWFDQVVRNALFSVLVRWFLTPTPRPTPTPGHTHTPTPTHEKVESDLLSARRPLQRSFIEMWDTTPYQDAAWLKRAFSGFYSRPGGMLRSASETLRCFIVFILLPKVETNKPKHIVTEAEAIRQVCCPGKRLANVRKSAITSLLWLRAGQRQKNNHNNAPTPTHPATNTHPHSYTHPHRAQPHPSTPTPTTIPTSTH